MALQPPAFSTSQSWAWGSVRGVRRRVIASRRQVSQMFEHWDARCREVRELRLKAVPATHGARTEHDRRRQRISIGDAA